MQHRLGGRHDDDEIRLDERRVDACRAHRDEPGILGVVHGHVTVEAAREVGRDERRELPLPGAAREPTGDEDRLVPARHAEPLELVHRGSDRELPRVALCAGNRQRGRLDDDRRPPRAAGALGERRPREREAERLAHGRRHVVERVARGRRAQDDRVVGHVEDRDPSPREERDPRHAIRRCRRRNVVRNPRLVQKRDESRFVTRQSVTIAS